MWDTIHIYAMKQVLQQKRFSIAVIGTGYVGLVSGACFAELGNKVMCADRDIRRIAKLKKGILPFYEPGLSALVRRNTKAGRLSFTEDMAEAVRASEIIFVCVGTPVEKSGQVNIESLRTAAESIGKAMKKPKTIVVKSTLPIGTGPALFTKSISRYWKGPFKFVSNPEFLSEGSAVFDFFHPDRIIIGADSRRSASAGLALYQRFACPKLVTSVENAGMIKYVSNAFLATKISFINEVANLCEKTGADVLEVARGIGLDKRIGKHFLRPGLGYGGSCLPKDLQAIFHVAKAHGYQAKLLRAVGAVNARQVRLFLGKIFSSFPNGKVRGRTIAVLGAAFKANTDDIRESVAVKLIKELWKQGAHVKVYDPWAAKNARLALGQKAQWCASLHEAASLAELLVIATEWKGFARLNWGKIKRVMKRPVVGDGRNLLKPQKMKALGFQYFGVGRNG